MLQNPHPYPWRHAPSLASCPLTSAGLPGGAPINARKASPTEPGQGNGRAAPRRGLLSMRQNTPSVIIQPVLIGRNAPDQVESSRWGASCLRHCGASMLAQRHRPRLFLGPSHDQHVLSYNPVDAACAPRARGAQAGSLVVLVLRGQTPAFVDFFTLVPQPLVVVECFDPFSLLLHGQIEELVAFENLLDPGYLL